MKILTLLVLVLIAIGLVIVATQSFNMTDSGDQKTFAKTYTAYLVKSAKNIKDLTKQAFKQDWEIENVTETS